MKKQLVTLLSTVALSLGMLVSLPTESEAAVIQVYGVYADFHHTGDFWPVTWYRDEQKAIDLIAERATTEPGYTYNPNPVPMDFNETAVLPSDDPDFVPPMAADYDN